MEQQKSRNDRIAEMLASGEGLKDFYRFTAQNPHIDLHDACQIVLNRPKASICFYIDEWNEMGRRVTKNRKGIPFYDTDGTKQIVFDLHDTHGDKRYRRLIFPMRRLLYGLDELNGTQLAESNRRDYSKILTGVAAYLEANGYFTEDEQRNGLLSEGVAYSLYSKTGFPKASGIALRGMPYGLDENARLFKEIYLLTEFAKDDISAAYDRLIRTPKILNDIEEETVSDEPIIQDQSEPALSEEYEEPAVTEKPAEQETTEPEDAFEEEEEPEPYVNPLYSRYRAAEQEKPESVVLIRVGDFYEVFGDRAKETADLLNLTLTSREVGLPERIPMCGFPWHVTDQYVEKILQRCSVCILEPDSEPVYISSHAKDETREPSQPTEPVAEASEEPVFDDAELTELEEILLSELTTKQFDHTIGEDESAEDIEDAEPEAEQDAGAEELLGEIYDEEETEEEPEPSEEPTPTNQSPRSGGRGIRERKRKNNSQISMFDMPDGKKSREEEIVDYCLKDEYSDYKIAYYDAYQKNLPIPEFVKLFKRHYGEYSGQSDGEKSITNTTKGRKIEWRDKEHPENNLTVQLKWPEVAVRIAELIENDDYLTPNEKEEYARIVRFRKERESAKTDGERCKVIADQIVEYGTHKTYSEVFSEYPHFLEDHAQFYFDHREEIKRELLTRKEVKSVEDKRDMFDDNISVSFYIKYCPRWQESLRRRLMREHRVQDYADEFIEECANNYETAPDGETIEWTVTPKETGELNYLFIKDYRDEFIEYLQSKTGVKSAKFSMDRIEITFDRDYIAGIADGELLPPIQQTRRVREIADKIIAEGTENTTEGNWVHFFDEFGEDETFARENAEEIAAELERHQEVSDVELTPDAIDTNFYLDYCSNYIPEEDETGYENEDQAEEEPTAVRETEPKPTHNRFTELTPEDRSYYESYIQRPYREPTYSPWEEVQDCTVIAPGIYSVSTAGHGGIMIASELAPHILSPEAVAEGDRDGWYYCYEEDVAICIPLRELYDKGILGNSYFSCNYFKTDREDAKGKYILYTSLTNEEKEKAIASWDKTLNESLAHWYPEYWQAYLQAKAKTQRKDKTDLNAVLDQNELGGAKTRFKNNIAAIRLAKFLYARNAAATDEEKKILAKYVGWGGLAQAFDETNKQWQKEYAELKSLLSDTEYSAAKGSVLNAHYTSKEIIDGIYSALQRFGVKGNNRILEPALGTGNFFGYMPQEIAAGANLYGVELDTVTGMIATKLYPQANVQIKGFEDTSYPDDYFDIAVSNVPFGGYGVYDSEYTRHKFLIHDYFIAKSIDKVKPGGIVAVITSKGTLDKLNPTARKYMAERAELLGAIRLPNNAFKQTANTEAVADILFFQKRSERLTDTSGIAWLGTGKTEDGFEINNYFLSQPEMVLGTFAKETGLYGAEGLTVKPDGRELGEAIKSAIENLPQNIYSNPDHSQETAEEKISVSVFDVRPMCYAAIRGKLYMRMGERLEEQEIPKHPKDAYDRIKGMIELRGELRRVLEMQSNGCTDEELSRAQHTLNAKYDVFVKKYGLLNSQTNTRLFREDGDAALVFACEKLSEDKTRATKADVFTKRTIRLYTAPTQTSSAAEALQICRNERGCVDISYIEELTGKNFETAVYELGNLIYRDPRCADEKDKYTGYVTAEEYLSGKVVEKLRIAKVYAENHPEYLRNVEALGKVQPEPLKASDISVRIGASWVKPEYYKQFLLELLKIDRYFSTGLTVRYNEYDNAWSVERMEYVRKNAGYLATETYGTNRANAFRLFEDCLNQRATSIYDTERLPDGKDHQVLNQAETIAAREKQNKIKEEFADWIYADPKRREDLEKTYNALFNQIRLPSYDGSYLKFPGMNPGIELRPHQKNAVARIAGTGDSTLLHHVVGSGKSYTMAASAMKLRQYGLAKKPMIVVPNHLVQQMANEFRTLYPTSKLLVAEKEDLEKNKRRQFVSKAAMGDWDSIIIAQSSFAKIPVSQERQKRKIEEEIQKIENSIQELKDKRGVRTAVKDLERIKKNKTAQLKKLTDSGKKDNVLIFENLGVDYLFVDEADAYKNLFLFTKMNNVSGISKAASARASDLQLKIEYINELHGGDKGVVFATGTPISNSMAEMYIMQTYLQKNTLRELGIDYFDGWAANFGETVTALEMAPSGQGYRARTRFAKFTNLPELMTLYRSFADVQTSETVKLDVPEAERETVTLEPSAQTIEIAESIAVRAERIYRGGVDPHMDNMLKVTSDGKKLALDIRCFDPILTDEQAGKTDVCADNVYRIYKETSDIRGTQLIFCDLSTPKKAYENYEYGKDFDVYNDLKHKLIERGVPESEIVFIHDAKTDKDKQALFDKMNEGKIRVLIGSTEKCGAGTNVQKRLAALHHLDAPYRPRDLQQRDGRGIRQGNLNKQVKIFTYVTKRTLDSYCYQILENKQRFISQIENGSLTVREAEDIDEKTLSYAEIKAITAANPKIKRKTELESELSRLRILEGQYKKNKYSLQDKIIKELPAKIREEEQRLAEVIADEKDIRANYDQEVFKIEVLGKEYTDKAAGGEALLSAVQMKAYGMRVAEFAGLKISVVAPNTYTREPRLQLEDHCKYEISMSESGTGLITRLLNFINTFSEKKTFYENNLAQYRRNLAVAEEELQKPFEHKEKIAEITKELSEINAELDLNKREEVVIESGEEDEPEAEEVNYMGLPGVEEKQPNPEKRSHRRMTEKLYRLYAESKAEKPDAVIFLKNGKYYETCGDDANTAAFVYGAVTYDKELAGERRSVAMLTYDDLNAMINDLSEENRRYEILEPENEIDSEVDFLETENESQAIAENAAEEKERAETPRIYPDNYIGTTAEVRYYPLSKRRAQQLFNLNQRVLLITAEGELIPITEQIMLDNTKYGYCIDSGDWYAFTATDAGQAYLYARLLAVGAAAEMIKQDLDYAGYNVDHFLDVYETEKTDLENYFEGRAIPSSETVKPYLNGLCREYASRLDGNGKLRSYGWWYEDIARAIAQNLPEQISAEAVAVVEKEMNVLKPEKTYYAVTEKDGEWRLYGIDLYDAVVTHIKFQTEEKRNKYINDMLAAKSGLRFEEVSYEKLQSIADEIKAKREAFIMQDRNVFKDIATIKTSVRPDYWITDEEMREYGYTQAGMFPLRERAAKRAASQFLLPVYKLYQNNAADQIKGADEIDAFGGIFGVKQEDWQKFLTTEQAQAYYSAARSAVSAAQKALNRDMGNVDARFTETVSIKLFAERNEIDRYIAQAGTADTAEMEPYIRQAVEEYAYWLNVKTPFAYGWDEDSIERAMLTYIEPTELKEYLNQNTGENIRYYGKDTENTAYAYVKGKLNDQAFQEIAARGSGADTFVIAANSAAFDAQAMQSRSMIYLEIGREIGEQDLSDEAAAIEKMQTVVDELSARRAEQSMELYQRVRNSVLNEYSEFEKGTAEELPYKQRFYKSVTKYFEKGEHGLLSEEDVVKLLRDDGKILARLYDYDWDGAAHDLSDNAEITVLIEYYNANNVSENAGTEDRDFITAVRERVSKIYEQYKQEHPDYANNAGKNLFYRKMCDYLQYTDTLRDKYFQALDSAGEEVMERMYAVYEQDGDLAIGTEREREEVIEAYTQQYHAEELCQAEKPKYFGKGTDGTAYYFLPQGLAVDTLPQIKEKAGSYVIAAPRCMLTDEEQKERHITFLKLGWDIGTEVYGTPATAKHAMRRAAEKIRRNKQNIENVCKNARTALEELQADTKTERAGYKERFFAAFAEFIEDANHFLPEGDFAVLIEDGDAVSERIYAYYMEMDEQIDFEDWEELSQLTKEYIDDRWKMQKAMTEGVPLYGGTLETAKANGEENLYRQSLRANIECKHEIDQAVNKNFDGYRLNKGFEQDLLDRFGMERVKYVLANTVQEQAWDGRYSPETKEWSNTVTIMEEKERRHQFELTSHPAVLDGFIARIRAAEKEMQQKKGEEVQEKDYRTETAKGLPVVHIEKDKYGHDIAIVKRQKDYVVAIGYDVKEGTWEQGRYDFPTQAAAQEYIDEKYKPQTQDTPKWLTAKVSRDALIRRYDKHSFMRMPNGEYENYTYNIYNSRIKESRQLVDMESDGRELCYELIFPADEEIVIKNRDGDEAIFTAEEFTEYIGGTSNADYERKEQSDDTTWYSVSVPQEALRGSYDRSSLFAMPTKGDFAGYSYYIPNVFIEEDKRGENGNILITLPEDFDVTLRNRETGEEVIVAAFDLFTECNETKGEDYSRAMSEPREIKKIQTIIPEKAKIAEYKTHTLFKMPDTGEYAGYCFYLFNDQIRAGETGIEVNLAEDFTVNLKNRSNDKNAQLTSGEFKAIMEKCKPEDFRLLKKPSAEHAEKFQKAEALYRKNLPPEMLARPNWVMVWTRKNEEKNRLDKFLISPVTDKFAEIDDPSTWVDFETACKYARENDGEALAYALDGKDKICCIDLDHCFNEKGQLSSTAQEAWKACGETYREVSVSKNGLHIFGKTDGMDLRVYAKDGDLEFYQKSHFITLTGNSFNSWKGLQNFDELPIKEYLEQKCEKRTAWQGAGQGIEGLSMLSDREVVERACAAKNGATFRAYYAGKDLRNNHSNSDMSFMIMLAFWCNGDINQMLRINATSGLYRPEKSPEYYEYTAMKAIRENPERFKPREKESDKTPRAKEDADKGGK